MTSKEIGEIRRHTRRDRSNMTALYGCFVNDSKEIISQFRLSLATMSEIEADQFFKLLKKNLSGTLGKNLIDITFHPSQVADSPEHKLLMDLRESRLSNDEILQQFYQKIVETVNMESNYLILIGCDAYDVPFKSRAGSDCADESYQYVLCCIFPVKLSKPAIEYKSLEKEFRNAVLSQQVTAPALGFLFPAFDERTTNIYGALFYTKDASARHESFIEAVFNTEHFVPAEEQKKCFDNLLSGTLEDECNLKVIQAVTDEITTKILLHKESHSNEPLTVSKEEITSVLTTSGVSEDKIAAFDANFDATFGSEAQIPPANIIDQKHFEVKTSDVIIRVKPDRSDLIETRVIGGVKYILICADEDVEVNGIKINIDERMDEM